MEEEKSLRNAFKRPGWIGSFWKWFDSETVAPYAVACDAAEKIDWVRIFPFALLHLGCLGVIWVGFTWIGVATAVGLYLVRMFAITAFYHRYFSHRTFRTSRTVQFLFALLGASAAQRGPLWWACQHRHHHQHADHEEDIHSPRLKGFWWAHVGWILCSKNFHTNYRRVRDWVKFPELVFLNRFDSLVPLALGVVLFGAGSILHHWRPTWNVTGPQLLVWGFFISTTFLFHATCAINSLAHVFGSRRYQTDDDSRNNFGLALLTLGEGWHNNHHRYMSCARQGFYWWEFDGSYYLLKLLSWVGVVWSLKPVPKEAFNHSGLARRGDLP